MEKPSILASILAGGVAGASETVITYPAEFVKTRRQLPQLANQSPSSISLIRSTVQTSGFSGLYSGCKALILSNAAKSGIRFMSFETTKSSLKPILGQASPWINILAGLSAGVTESILVVTPGEAIKTKIIHDASMAKSGGGTLSTSSLPTAVMRIVQAEGIFSLWRGLGPVLCKQGTNSAVRFATFGLFQEKAEKVWTNRKGKPEIVLLAGALSGVVTTYASMPFDNIKTRMQSIGNVHKGIVDCGFTMLRNEGIGVFWKATTPRLVRLTLSSGITFMVFDQMIKLIALAKREGRHTGALLH